jgi:hypothetical protein
MPNTKKPYVAAACVCEKIVTEPDGVNSIIRIVDTYTIPECPGLPPDVRPTLNLLVYVSLKSGAVTGSHDIGIVLRRPDGTKEGPQRYPVVFPDMPEGGVNLQLNIALARPGEVPAPGLYWCGVLWDWDDELTGIVWDWDDELTSIPFRVKRAEPTKTPPEG